MNLTELIFFFGFLFVIFITLIKIINTFKVGEWYNLSFGFILFFLYCFSWYMLFAATSMYIDQLIYFQLLKLANILFIPNVLFLFFEIFFNLKSESLKIVKPYNPKDFKK